MPPLTSSYDCVVQAIIERLRSQPDRIAVCFRGARDWDPPVTGAELERAIHGAARALAEAGVTAGDRVLLAIDTGLPVVAALLGGVALGAVPVIAAPYYGGLGEASTYLAKLQETIELTEARLTVVPAAMREHLAGLGTPLLADEALRREADPLPLQPSAASDTCLLQLTSGSTGIPRAVRVTHGNVFANARAIDGHAASTADDRILAWIPLFHDMGLQGALLYPLLHGFPTYLMSPSVFIRSPGVWLESIGRHRATMILAPNFSYTLVRRVLQRKPVDPELLSSVRITWNGAEPIQAESLEAFVEAAAPYGYARQAMKPCYGLGEATLVVSCTSAGEGPRIDLVASDALADGVASPVSGGEPCTRVVSCGTPAAGMRIRVLDEAGGELPDRRVGEVVVASPSVSPGYHGDDRATRATFRDGWLHTGDLGYLADGHLYLVGRRKDVLIIHGQKFAPQAVEWAAEKVEGVRAGRTAAFSVPDAAEGSERVIVACECLVPPEQHAELARAIAARTLDETGLRVEAWIVPRGTVPKTTSGKIQRSVARALFLRRGGAEPVTP